MDEFGEELARNILQKGEEVNFEGKVFKLSDEEEDIVDSIGEENFDYCVAALLQHRNPNQKIILHEEKGFLDINDKVELEFNPDVWKMGVDHPRDAIADAVGYISLVFIENIEEFEKL